MPHKASDSVDPPSFLTSLSSEASVELYQESIKPKTAIIINSSATLQELVDAAETMVNGKFASDSRRNFTFTKDKKKASMELDKVMLAMLAFAEECGGESGKRYVAAAICSCSGDNDVVGALAALGTAWLTHFLFVFKTRGGHQYQRSETPSPVITPTSDPTTTHLQEEVGYTRRPFSEDVIRRDRYQCILTGYQARTHPNPAAGIRKAVLAAAHILIRAVGQFDKNPNSASFEAASTTFDILANFARLPVKTLEELCIELDNPSNRLTLELYAHAAFDAYDWCLKKTEVENVYNLKIFSDEIILNKPETNRITFTDHSNDFSDSPGDLKRTVPVDLPNACYIGIHAAIAEILHMSGAGNFFDEVLDTYREDEDKVSAVRCWPELEKLIDAQLLRAALIQSFKLARA